MVKPLKLLQALCAVGIAGTPVFVYLTRDAGPALWMGAVVWWLLLAAWSVGMEKRGL